MRSTGTRLTAMVALVAFCGLAAGQVASRPSSNSRPADGTLPNILLIGDSISMQYTPYVQQRLSGKAVVKRIPTNGGSTVRGLKYIDEWLGAEHWDVIHFNFGGHDLMVMREGNHQVAIEQYEANLRKLVARLRRTGARLVWASTTPMPEGKLLLTGTLGIRMSNADAVAYNVVAARVMKEHGIPIDDLYAFALPKLHDLLIPIDVHLTFSGAAAIAEPVAESILAALGRPVPASVPATGVEDSRPSTP